jgi:hypothetical protein
MPDFAAWMPDAYLLNADAAAEASGVLCKAGAYAPLPQPATQSLAVGTATVTVTIANPAVVTWTAHALIATDTFTFLTTGALPTGITAGTTYFVIAAGLGANVFEFSTSSGGAAVITTGSQSGVHTGTYSDTVIRGAFAARDNSNAIKIYAWSAKKAWRFAGASSVWTMVASTTYGLATDDYWSVRQFGDTLIAANGSDTVQGAAVNAGTSFAALAGSPPNSRYVEIVGDFVQLGSTATSRRSVKWSGRNDAATWTAYTKDSDSQVFVDGGDVMGMAGFELGGLIFQTETVRRQTARTDSAIFEFHRIDAARGTPSPYSIVKDGGDVYYYSYNGFMRIGADGSIVNIGIGRVNDWFKANANISRPKAYIGALDPIVRRIFWLCPSASNASSTTLDLLIVYDIERDRWTHATVALTYLFTAATAGITLSALAALYSTLSAVPYPFGSDVWKGGAPGLAAFDTNKKLCFFIGTPSAASVQTSPFEAIPGSRAFINGFRLNSDTVTATGKVGGAARPQDMPVFNGSQSLNAQGRIPARISTRVAQVQVDVPAGATWTSLGGIEFEDGDLKPDGKR